MAPAGLGGSTGADLVNRGCGNGGTHRHQSRHVSRSGINMGVGINVRDLKAYFGAAEALHGIDMTMGANQVTAIIGPSGCGKSTFVRCLNRMHETIPGATVKGEVVVGDTDVYKATAVDIRRRIGMVFQKPNPFPTMSIYDNVAAGLKLNGVRNHRKLDEIVEGSLKQSALWDEVK